MSNKRGLGLSWDVLIPIIIVVILIGFSLFFGSVASDSIKSAMNYIKSLFRFG